MPNTANRLEFNVEPIPYFLKSLLAGLSLLIFVPAAEKLTDLIRYCVSHMRFADGTTVTYYGKPEEIKEPLLQFTILIWAEIILSSSFEDPWIEIGISAAASVASAYILLPLLRLIASHLTTNHGSQLFFSGTKEEFLKWQLLIAGATLVPSMLALILPSTGFLGWIASITAVALALIALAVVLTPYSQWFASKCTGGLRTATFGAEPLEVAGMYVGFVLFSLFIVTIPWSVQWFMKWYFGKFSLPARSALAAAR